MKTEMEYIQEYVDSVWSRENTFEDIGTFYETAQGAYADIIRLKDILDTYNVSLTSADIEYLQEELTDQKYEVWYMAEQDIVQVCIEIMESIIDV